MGLPLAVSTHAANHHEVALVQLSFDCYMIEAKPGNLIGARAYERDKLDEALHEDGIKMIAPYHSNRKKRKRRMAAVCDAASITLASGNKVFP